MNSKMEFVIRWGLVLICLALSAEMQDVMNVHGTCYHASCGPSGAPSAMSALCRCDAVCRFFGDCCADFYFDNYDNETLSGHTTDESYTSFDIEGWECVTNSYLPPYTNFSHGFIMLGGCPRHWPLDDVRATCESSEIADIQGTIYVGIGVFVKRLSCAICNGVSSTSLTEIKGSDKCQWLSDGTLACLHKMKDSLVPEPLRSLAAYTRAIQSVPKPRVCLVDVVTTCPNNTQNNALAIQCEVESRPIFVSTLNGGSLFKNSACALCSAAVNIVCVSSTTPIGNNLRDVIQTLAVPAESQFDSPDMECQSKTKKGTDIGDSVKSKEKTDGEITKDLHADCLPETSDWPKCGSRHTWLELIDEDTSCFQALNCRSDYYYASFDKRSYMEVEPPCLELREDYTDAFIYDVYRREVEGPLLYATEEVIRKAISNDTSYQCSNITAILHEQCVVEQRKNDDLDCSELLFTSTLEKFTPTTVQNEIFVFYNTTYIKPLWWRNNTFMNFTGRSVTKDHYFILCGSVAMGLSCKSSQVVMNSSVQWTTIDGLLMMVHDGRIFNTEEFLLHPDGNISICLKFLSIAAPERVDTIENVLYALSSLCLLMTFITYLVFPVLRNSQGIAIMNLLVALFLGQILLQYVGDHLTLWPVLCVTAASLSHYFILSSFVWMTILAFGLSRTFSCSNVHHLSYPSRSIGRTATLSVCTGWGIPLIFVVVTFIFQFSDYRGDLIPEYGGPSCWFTTKFGNIVMFFSPICVCILANIVFFLRAVHGIHSTKKITTNLKDEEASSLEYLTAELKIYIKMSGLLGFSWLVGFFAMVINVPAIWYIFTTLHSLQGALIFVSFGVSQRARRLWKAALRRSRLGTALALTDQSRYPSKTATSGRSRNQPHYDVNA